MNTHETRRPRRVAIVGAGKLGLALARLSLDAGFETLLAARPKPMRDLILSTVVPGARVITVHEAATADLVILAVPRPARDSVVAQILEAGTPVAMVDATNPWEATGTGGAGGAGEGAGAGESRAEGEGRAEGEVRAEGKARALLIRGLHHVAYEELAADSRTPEQRPRRALALVKPDDPRAGEALAIASRFVDNIGFDPVTIQPSAAPLFEPSGELFGAWLDVREMRAAAGS